MGQAKHYIVNDFFGGYAEMCPWVELSFSKFTEIYGWNEKFYPFFVFRFKKLKRKTEIGLPFLVFRFENKKQKTENGIRFLLKTYYVFRFSFFFSKTENGKRKSDFHFFALN